MNHILKIVIAMIIFSAISVAAVAEQPLKQDSIAACINVSEFFNWYLRSIKENSHFAYQPKFIEAANGNTTLDFSTYISNLKKYHFSDSLICNEQKSYQKCISSLSKINYRNFVDTYKDLDQFEEINCDYENTYRWFHTQEAPDTCVVDSYDLKNKNSAIVTIQSGSYNNETNKYLYYRNTVVYLIKTNNIWKINVIEN